MKIYVDFEDGKDMQLAGEYNATQEKLMQDDLLNAEYQEDTMRRLRWVLDEKVSGCIRRLSARYLDNIKAKHDSIPSNDLALAELIFKQDDYKPANGKEDFSDK